jgi:hypothetical protein
LAAAAVFHAIDYLGVGSLRKKFRENADFALVDRIAHAFKHVQTGHPNDPNLQPLSSKDVISRPPPQWDVAVWDLSHWDDPTGGVTLDADPALDVLSTLKRAAEFMRAQIGKGDR